MRGRMRHPIKLIRRVDGAELETGGTQVEDEIYAKVWANKLQPAPGRELKDGDVVIAEQTTDWEMWHRRDVKTSDVIQDEHGDRFEVVSQRDLDGQRDKLIVTTKRIEDK